MLDSGLQEAEQRLTFPPSVAPFMKAPTGPCDVHCAGAAAHLLLTGMGPTIASQVGAPADQGWPGSRPLLAEHLSRSWRVTSPVPAAPGAQQQSRSKSVRRTPASSLASSRLVPVARLPRPSLGSGSSSASDRQRLPAEAPRGTCSEQLRPL